MSDGPDAGDRDGDRDREQYRRLVRAWLDEHAPAKGSPEDFSAAHVVSADTREAYESAERAAQELTRNWQATLHAGGWAGIAWPTEYGGRGAPQWQADVFAEEQARYGVSTKMLAVALEMVPPVLLEHGTHEQRVAHLPRIVSGDESWCQLLSEPDAGSDLTSVACLATPVDGGWTVSGQKVWTSGAVSADFAILIARSDPTRPGRDGISCFILDMAQPGVQVRPLRQMSGGYHFNEVFLDDAFVPEADLVGPLGAGFAALRTMLVNERSAIGGGTSARATERLRVLADALGLSEDPTTRQELALAHTREWLLDQVRARLADIPAGPSIAKLLYSEHGRLSGDTAMALLGARAFDADDEVAAPFLDLFLFAPGLRIGGGTDEIQRTTIAERGLGLPREPSAPRPS